MSTVPLPPLIKRFAVDTGHKLSEHKTFRRRVYGLKSNSFIFKERDFKWSHYESVVRKTENKFLYFWKALLVNNVTHSSETCVLVICELYFFFFWIAFFSSLFFIHIPWCITEQTHVSIKNSCFCVYKMYFKCR